MLERMEQFSFSQDSINVDSIDHPDEAQKLQLIITNLSGKLM